jgi:RNA polymerase sigma-70 factor, ECF subfamily
MSDKELIERIIRGDDGAFRQLVEKYQQKVFSTCNGFLHNKEDAEDIAQDVFVEVYQSIDKFRNEAKISTWLYRISVNKSLNWIKKNRKHNLVQSLESFFNLGDDSNSDEIESIAVNNDDLEKEESNLMLYKAIESLGTNQRIAFSLNKFDELSYKEISEVMNISVSSVESLIHRAKMNLQKTLYKYYNI